MRKLLILTILIMLAASCRSRGTKVVKPKTHKVWPAGNKYLIDIPVGARHIRLFKRKRTTTVNMR